MKSHHVVVSTLLLGLTEALTFPNQALGARGSSDSSSLKWAPCDIFSKEIFEELGETPDCARLEVPLDYSDKDNKETLNLQLLRMKATKTPVKGNILYNPGGPGGSGVEGVLGAGPLIREILNGQYNIIGFDPRGTGRTIPFDCGIGLDPLNTTSKARRDEHEEDEDDDLEDLPTGDPWPQIRKEVWNESTIYADACYNTQKDTGRFVGTTFVARDMLNIVDALGGDKQLHYWGISYGSALGQVFASMFPDRIGRMMLDSNLLADNYVTSLASLTTRNTEDAFDKFLSDCVEAGPEVCLLANYSGPSTTEEDLKTAVVDLFDALIEIKELPEEYDDYKEIFPYGGNSVLILLKNYIIGNLYGPVQYPALAKLVYNALEGNWLEAFSVEEGGAPSDWNRGVDAYLGVLCSDASFRADEPDDMYSIVQSHLSNGAFAEGQVGGLMTCAQWKFDAAERIDTNKLHDVDTSFPILFVNGPYDPVTPLVSAWDASSRYRKSRMLVHHGVGHAFLSHTSKCTNAAVRAYFLEGKMPEVGTECEPDLTTWEYIEELQKKQGGDP